MSTNMSMNGTTTEETGSSFTTSYEANRIKFWILLSLQFVSLPCFIYVFYQFTSKKSLRQSVHHHVIVLLLIISFLFVTCAFSLTMAYMYTSEVYPSTYSFCSFWNWFHYSLNIINLFLMAFASMERNWLVFYPHIMNKKREKYLLHYCPLTFCIFYPPIFYAIAIFVHQCDQFYDYTQLLCICPCYFASAVWASVDTFFNNYTPLFAIPVFCTALYVRVWIQKSRLKQQRFKWRRDKKMLLQLWAVSSLYLVMWMPLQLAGLVDTYWIPTFLLQPQIDYMYLFPYFIHVIYPFIVLLSFRQEMVKPSQATGTVFPMNQLGTVHLK